MASSIPTRPPSFVPSSESLPTITVALAFRGVHEAAWRGLLLLAAVVHGLYRSGAPREA
jgi:hypothetical protein